MAATRFKKSLRYYQNHRILRSYYDQYDDHFYCSNYHFCLNFKRFDFCYFGYQKILYYDYCCFTDDYYYYFLKWRFKTLKFNNYQTSLRLNLKFDFNFCLCHHSILFIQDLWSQECRFFLFFRNKTFVLCLNNY